MTVISKSSSLTTIALSYGEMVGNLGMSDQDHLILRKILGNHLIAVVKLDGSR